MLAQRTSRAKQHSITPTHTSMRIRSSRRLSLFCEPNVVVNSGWLLSSRSSHSSSPFVESFFFCMLLQLSKFLKLPNYQITHLPNSSLPIYQILQYLLEAGRT